MILFVLARNNYNIETIIVSLAEMFMKSRRFGFILRAYWLVTTGEWCPRCCIRKITTTTDKKADLWLFILKIHAKKVLWKEIKTL